MTNITRSPWGAPQSIDQIGEGICFVSTAGHGGYFVPPELNRRVPAAWRAISFNGQGNRGWYEEDCDAAMVVLAFPHLFPVDALPRATAAFQQWHAPKLASARGLTHGAHLSCPHLCSA